MTFPHFIRFDLHANKNFTLCHHQDVCHMNLLQALGIKSNTRGGGAGGKGGNSTPVGNV